MTSSSAAEPLKRRSRRGGRHDVEAIGILVENHILPAAETTAYRGMIGFRNVAVHNYREIDQAIVTGIVHNHLDDLERFAARVSDATINRG